MSEEAVDSIAEVAAEAPASSPADNASAAATSAPVAAPAGHHDSDAALSGDDGRRADADRPKALHPRREVRYLKAAGSRKERLEKERLLHVEIENKRLLASLNRIYNGTGGRRRSLDNNLDATRPSTSANPPPIELGRATKLAPEHPTSTAARHAAAATAAKHAIPITESAYLGTLTLPHRCVNATSLPRVLPLLPPHSLP
jgi:hypothetical protein